MVSIYLHKETESGGSNETRLCVNRSSYIDELIKEALASVDY